MPPFTSPDRPLRPVCWRLLLVLACLLVFCFALHAKVAIYGHSVQPHASTASKLWLDGKKLDVQSPSLTFVLLCLTPILLAVRQQFELRRFVHHTTPPASALNWRYLHRFLRPPPPSF